MPAQSNVQSLVEYLLNQASTFLSELGNFHPFGSAILKDEKLESIDAYDADIQKNIVQLENRIAEKIKSGDFILAGICIQIAIKTEDSIIDALEVRLMQAGGAWGRMFCPVKMEGGKMQIGEFVREVQDVKTI